MENMTPMKAIKTFFEANGGRKVDIAELKALSIEEKNYLAEESAKQLGVELVSAV